MENLEKTHYSWHEMGDDALTIVAILLGAVIMALVILAIGYIILEVFQEINQRVYPFDFI